MAVTPKQLIPGSVLTAGSAAYYTAPASTKAIIQKAVFTNLTSGALTMTAWVVPSGAAPGSNYQINISLTANQTLVDDKLPRKVVPAGGAIYFSPSAGGAIAAMVDGVEVT